MTPPSTLSVRIDPGTRSALDEEAQLRGVSGASSLAREILVAWAAEQNDRKTRVSIERAVSYLIAHPDGWDDEPSDFFAGGSAEA